MLREMKHRATSHLSKVSPFKSIILSILSGILLALPFVDGRLWICAWFSFMPLFSALRGQSKRKAFLLSYGTGIIFWSATIYWLIHVTLPGTIILILYLALYFGIFGLFFVTMNYQLSTINQLSISAAWVLLEYARSHALTGFPWALLGYSQLHNLPLIQISALTGVWGVSFLVMLGNVRFAYLRLQAPGSKPYSKLLTPFVPLLLLSLGYGYYSLYLQPVACGLRHVKISIVQGNIPQELKWNSNAQGYILDKYLSLTQQAVQESPALVVWPEAASPGMLGIDSWIFKEIFSLSKKSATAILLGTVYADTENRYFNSALLVNSAGEIAGRYDKLHLVPFGEYIPLKKILPFLETIVPIGDITPGKEYVLFQAASRKPPACPAGRQAAVKFGVLICFEDLFGELSRRFVKRGAEFLVTITNDAWYKRSTAAFQHLQACVFRAVENRVYVVRAANTGYSAFINPQGKIEAMVQDAQGWSLFVDGVRTQEIAVERKPLSFYSYAGDFYIFVCVIFIGFWLIARRRSLHRT